MSAPLGIQGVINFMSALLTHLNIYTCKY